MSNSGLHLPPGATLETTPPAGMKLPPGATLESTPAKTPEMPGAFDIDYPKTSYGWATASGLQTVGRGLGSAVKGAYEFLKPPSWEEIDQAMKDGGSNPVSLPTAILARRMGKGVGQTASQATQVPGAVRDINASPDPTGTYANVAQETAGQGAGQAIVAASTEGLGNAAGKVLPKAVSGAKSVIPEIGSAEHAALATKVAQSAKILGQSAEDLPVIGGFIKAAKKAGALKDVWAPAGEPAVYPKTPEGPTATPEQLNPSLVSPARTMPGQISPEVIRPPAQPIPARPGLQLPPGPQEAAPTAAAQPASAAAQPEPVAAQPAAAAPKRSIVTDPDTGKPEFSDVLARRKELNSKLGDLMDKIQEQQQAKSAARVPADDEDLTNLLQQSLDQVKAQKGGVYTSAAPADLAKRWGVSSKSIVDTDANVRGLSPQESKAYVDQLADSYRKGRPVEPVMETRDADNNIVSVDGRHRALAAQKAGVERIPVIVRRMPAPAATPQ